jgi:hypothetical protein
MRQAFADITAKLLIRCKEMGDRNMNQNHSERNNAPSRSITDEAFETLWGLLVVLYLLLVLFLIRLSLHIHAFPKEHYTCHENISSLVRR